MFEILLGVTSILKWNSQFLFSFFSPDVKEVVWEGEIGVDGRG